MLPHILKFLMHVLVSIKISTIEEEVLILEVECVSRYIYDAS